MARNNTVIALLFWLSIVPLTVTAEDYNVGDTFRDTLRSGGSGPEMVVIPGGIFILGGGSPGQHDLGKVKIDYRLAFGTKELTNGEYRQFLQATRSAELGKFPKGKDEFPATGISWDEAEAYLTWLSRETGHHYRLPSASEWEYAARAGTTTLYFWGDKVGENMANCLDCASSYDGVPGPVGAFKANPWGLFDTHGNAWEWTKDCIDSNSAPPANGMPKLFGNCDSRELRGGSAQSDAWSIRAGARAFALRGQQMSDVGLRVVMVISQ